MPHRQYLSSIDEIIEDARNGRMFILVDDEDRENEGDLVIPAQMATPEAINFMAKYGRGLICLSLTNARVRELNLPRMAKHNGSRHETAFTVSIEAKEGVTTGISASDRARTISVAIDPAKGIHDIATPGHVFPLEARDGGVLVRAGHTEAAVDVSRLAGLNPSGVICEIMNEDGTMARMDDLIVFAKTHQLKIATIADLIRYRLRNDHLVERTLSTTLDSEYGGTFDMSVYVSTLNYAEHVVLSKGDIATKEPVLVRMHALNLLEDVLGDTASGKAHELHRAMRAIADEGRGVIVLLREPNPETLSQRVRSKMGDGDGAGGQLRDYGVGAQILRDLGLGEIVLLSNTQRTIVGLEGYELKVVGQRPIGGGA
ncbi:3,4-dihydroxy-2-butanone-4-phosphate synthase [Varunaivibrio sulfuroxidans]|uniref:3,4-dihydroxy-2-butanone 4-phosphate synthase n=1 Tax=Varunaivibrio sulfuroxidans TaxID=1773489 RepID=A0A4R3JEF2_9PROT|nr:3,4-dihydroxy-2-butanone-4-phosphate synthase [Varunaivibrio sulfuroxidans]TCS64262.1 3,4-dihydroxy 2-butanone 4-phosphate synthase/GTP cyclohydrolase II [Varunaivibrio sulfuroxidans]WES31300.1 3,4-dihydroxy-2-butanone-4-phosphate synthase [Varunaivibrio sulfuroxidans]